MIIDDLQVFIEKYHPPGSDKRHGVTMRNARHLGPWLALNFQEHWDRLAPSGVGVD